MKVASGSWLRSRSPIYGVVVLGALGGVVAGCGDKESSPDAVSVSELKYPGDLVIWDKGDGKIELEWSGANNEDDFDGYNVYGMKDNGALGITEGVALELLDDKGEKNAATEAILAKFNYDPVTNKLEAPGTAIALADAAEGSEDGPEFSYLPIHSGPADARLLPTCKPTAGTCTMTTAATQEATAGSNPAYAVNGRVKFAPADTLKVGDRYCFFVMSSMDGGETVSQTSSNVQCVTPKYAVAFNMPIPAAPADNAHFDLRAYLTACDTAGKCAAPAAPIVAAAADSAGNTAAPRSHVASDEMPIYLEVSSTGALGFVAGKAAAINDLGYYEKGFDDMTLPKGSPVLVMDDTTIGGTGVNKDAPVFNAGGYSIPGQTVPLVVGHVYVFGVGALTATGVGPYNYHWLYVKGAPAAGTAAVEMRLTKKAI